METKKVESNSNNKISKTYKRVKKNRLCLSFSDEDFKKVEVNFKLYSKKKGQFKNISPYLEDICINNKSIIVERKFNGLDIKLLSVIGNNMNQIAKRMHQLNKVSMLPEPKLYQKLEETIKLFEDFYLKQFEDLK